MNSHTDNIQGHKDQSASAAGSQMQISGESNFKFVDNRPEALAQRKIRAIANPNETSSAIVQGYFTDKTNMSPFGPRPANQETLTKVRQYLQAQMPENVATFDKIEADQSAKGSVCLQDWLKSIGTSFQNVELASIKQQFPQTKEIPESWVSSTKAHNPGGPPLMLQPPELDSPTSSQDEEMGIEEEDIRPTDLVTDISVDKFTYHRNKKTYPITPQVKSELRAGTSLTNTFIDQSPAPLIGANTQPIKKETDSIRKKARKEDPKSSTGKTLSHHPDTFWLPQPSSQMGWHPVTSTTNTLEGDSHDLPKRTGQQLTGMVLKESSGYTRPTLEAQNAHTERVEEVEMEIAKTAADVPSIREKLDAAEEMAISANAINLWKALEAVVERLEIGLSEGDDPSIFGEIATDYLGQTFDQLPASTASVNSLLEDIAQELRDL